MFLKVKMENSISIPLEATARAADIMSAEISFLPHKLTRGICPRLL